MPGLPAESSNPEHTLYQRHGFEVIGHSNRSHRRASDVSMRAKATAAVKRRQGMLWRGTLVNGNQAKPHWLETIRATP